MPSRVPFHRVLARAESWPLSSDESFRGGLLAMRRGGEDCGLDAETAPLGRALEEYLRPRVGGLSVEIVRQLRDLAWFRDGCVVNLTDHVLKLADWHLQLHGPEIRLKASGVAGIPGADGGSRDHVAAVDPSIRAQHWRWLTLHLPADLLAAALSAREGIEPATEVVTLLTPGLRRVLEGPVAQTHLHIGAAIPFSLLWTGLMWRLSVESVREQELRRGGSPPFGGVRAFVARLYEAAIARVVMAEYLLGPAREHFDDVIARVNASLRPRGQLRFEPGTLLREVCGNLAHARPSAPSLNLRRLYQSLIPPVRLDVPREGSEVAAADPLFGLFQLVQGTDGVLAETLLTYHALRRVTSAPDPFFEALFWQYQRVRCRTYAHVVQEPGTSGLDWFTQHYDRISGLRGELDRAVVRVGLEVDARDANVSAFEVRTAPPTSWVDLRDLLRSYAWQARQFEPPPGRTRPEFGVVLHFLKRWKGNRTGGQRQARSSRRASPNASAPGSPRYAAWYYEQLRSALAIEHVLRRSPELLVILRGIDICNVELAVPTWPVQLLYARVQKASQEASRRLASIQPHWTVPPLRATVHVGEEYRRLSEGVRRVHEAIEFGLLAPGDRVGHALALADDPQRWGTYAASSAQPREERLDDLLWELERYERGELPVEPSRLARVRAEASAHGRRIYEQEDLRLLGEARRLRHSPEMMEELGYPAPIRHLEMPSAGTSTLSTSRGARELVRRYLHDVGAWERGGEPVDPNATADELAMLQQAQAFVRRTLARMEITIETNPSSNLVIGDYHDVGGHPAFRMAPLRPGVDDIAMLISINTDDPITFSTRLADEYAHMYFAMLRSGVSAADALTWLERVRSDGFRSRFTIPASSERAVLDQLVARRVVGFGTGGHQ